MRNRHTPRSATSPDPAAEFGGRHQPVTLSEAGRLCLRAVHGWGSDQVPHSVVGAGSSGARTAEELQPSGSQVYHSLGPHDPPPRRYRGQDFVWWQGKFGRWDVKTRDPATEHVTIAVSGAHGGQTTDFRRLTAQGVKLLGRDQGPCHHGKGPDTGASTLRAIYLADRLRQAAD